MHIYHSSSESDEEIKIGGEQGHEKELSSLRELFPVDTCRPGNTNHCYLENRDSKLGPYFMKVFCVQTDPHFLLFISGDKSE